MIGPSGATAAGGQSIGGAGDGTSDEHQLLLNHDPSKRSASDELEKLYDEVCGHQHQRLIGQPPPSKRPRYLAADFQSAAVLLDHDIDELQNEPIYSSFDCQQSQILDGPMTRLEVLVVDGTWDDAFENFYPVTDVAATQTNCTPGLTELNPVAHEHQNHHQQQQYQVHNLQNINYQDSYWNHQQQQLPAVPTTVAAMPKIQNNDSGRSRFTPMHNSSPPSTLPQSLHPSAYEDQENGNLSWLLDFKLDSLIEAPEDKSTVVLPRDTQGNKSKFNGSNNSSSSVRAAAAYNAHESSSKKSYNYDSSNSAGVRYNNNNSDNAYSPPAAAAAGNYGLAENRNRCSGGGSGPKKPPFTYTELIEHALQERGELTVSAIYQWISEHFPYYKSNDDRWKNSVRHNLSINPHFRKGSKAPHGAGHLWAIASQDESKPRQFFNIASIRQAIRNEEAAKAESRVVTMNEAAVAAANISQPTEEENLVDSITLEHCAEQILSGIKKEVEVQYLVPMMVSNNGEPINNQQCHHQNVQPTDHLCPVKETDFLNPVSKEVVAEECGLIGEGYLITDLNPSSLGLNMAESEIVSTDNLFGEELSFQFYEFASPSQLQSA